MTEGRDGSTGGGFFDTYSISITGTTHREMCTTVLWNKSDSRILINTQIIKKINCSYIS